MSRGQKIQALLDHCDRHRQLGALLKRIEETNAAQYARFASTLRPGTLPGQSSAAQEKEIR